jgi:hypothetical protein
MTHTHSPIRTLERRTRASYEAALSPLAAQPAHAEIARLAYSYWEARGRHGGSPWEDWFRAEKELCARMAHR